MKRSLVDGTMAAGIVRSVVDVCVQQGLPREQLMHTAGLVNVNDPEARVPIARAHDVLRTLQPFQHAWPTSPAAAVRCTDCGPVGFMLLTAPDMACLLDALCRYYQLVVDLGSWSARWAGDGVHLVFEPGWDAELLAGWVEAAVSTCMALLRDAVGSPPIQRVQFRHSPRHGGALHWRRVFQSPVVFGAECNSILISDAVTSLTPRLRNEPMYRYFERQMEARLSAVGKPRRLVDRVRLVIDAQLASGDVSITAIARQLGVSGRTLRRRLDEEGCSFRELVHQCRMDAAERMLARRELSVTEIAAALGFSEASAFSRAFRRQRGVSPSGFRVT